MHDEHPHPLLAQVPLTLSPFLSLPTPVPLPYSYKTLPSTLPPSILQQPVAADQAQQAHSPAPAYVVSSTGTTATPDQILSSCVALQRHLDKLEADARSVLGEWEERLRGEELAEKRRVAPGWLDSGVHMLKPELLDEGKAAPVSQAHSEPPQLMDLDPQAESKRKEGEDLDRVFGRMKV